MNKIWFEQHFGSDWTTFLFQLNYILVTTKLNYTFWFQLNYIWFPTELFFTSY